MSKVGEVIAEAVKEPVKLPAEPVRSVPEPVRPVIEFVSADRISLAENIAAVTTVRATYQDMGTTFSYSLSGGVDAAKFRINSSTGALTFIFAPD